MIESKKPEYIYFDFSDSEINSEPEGGLWMKKKLVCIKVDTKTGFRKMGCGILAVHGLNLEV